MEIRSPAVAGRFYPGTPTKIAEELRALMPAAAPRAAAAVMCPHAGWVYSGKIAGGVLAQIDVPARVIVLCPNHTGRGARVSIMTSGAWRTPVGDVPVDEELAAILVEESQSIRGARADRAAHEGEHAIEVLVPMLLARQPALTMTPVVVGPLDTGECTALGHAIARAVERVTDRVLVVASSDMSHYLPDPETRRRDKLALAALVSGDEAALMHVCDEHEVSMCGVRPAAAMLAYVRARKAGAPELVGYATSGDAFGDRSSVVGYAGVIVPP
ncbi:MAG TPA: AmmeMemoRadiSam system protein B [Kofleriaceae bacterium]|nr:AmmeMemoRadiSam system protein B [Kofleriaceae bacterium]